MLLRRKRRYLGEHCRDGEKLTSMLGDVNESRVREYFRRKYGRNRRERAEHNRYTGCPTYFEYFVIRSNTKKYVSRKLLYLKEKIILY